MKTNLIIGAGQLGSRHLQGLLGLKTAQEIYVLDPSQSSLQIAKDRALEIANEHKVYYVDDWSMLPRTFSLVIVATGSNVREMVVARLLDHYAVDYLVLEKVLFQDIASYNRIKIKAENISTKIWVNHPRRMFEHYRVIKDVLYEAKEAINFHVLGYNWGLGCNGLHLIDLCAFISGSQVKELNAQWIDNVLLESKRPGYNEFTGALTGQMDNGSVFSVSSLKSELVSLSIVITTPTQSWVIEEGVTTGILYQNNQAQTTNKTYNATLFQSSLTTMLAEDIFSKGDCSLPTYLEACRSHEPFILALLEKYNEITGSESKLCPIT